MLCVLYLFVFCFGFCFYFLFLGVRSVLASPARWLVDLLLMPAGITVIYACLSPQYICLYFYMYESICMYVDVMCMPRPPQLSDSQLV